MNNREDRYPHVPERLDARGAAVGADPGAAGVRASLKQQGAEHPGVVGRLKYYFSLRAALASSTPNPIEVAGGTRLHLSYSSTKDDVFTDGKKYEASWKRRWNAEANAHSDPSTQEKKDVDAALKGMPRPNIQSVLGEVEKECRKRAPNVEWFGLSGKVLNGGDTVLVRDDGVIVFDARFTIQDGDVVIDATAFGVADLKELGFGSGADAYAAFRGGTAKKDLVIPVQLAMSFETPGAPGDAAEYAAKRYITQNLRAWKFERLARRQLVGVGRVTADGGRPCWPARGIELEVSELIVPGH